MNELKYYLKWGSKTWFSTLLLFSSILFLLLSCNSEKEPPFKIDIKDGDKDVIDSLGISFVKHLEKKQNDSIIIAANQLIKFMEHKPYLNNARLMLNYELGVAYSRLEKYDSATISFKKAMLFFEQESRAIDVSPYQYVRTLVGVTRDNTRNGNHDKVIRILYKGLVNLNGKKPDLRSQLYYKLGYTYWYMRDFDSAEKMFKKSLVIPESSEDTKNGCYMGLGDTFIHKDLDSANHYFFKALPYLKKRERKVGFHVNNTNIAEVLIKKGKLNEAKKLLLEAIVYYKKVDSQYDIGRAYMFLAEIAELNKNINPEYLYLEKAKPFIEKRNVLNDLEKLYFQFSKYYERTGKQILKEQYLTKSHQIREGIYNVKKRIQVNFHEIKHLNEINELKIHNQQLLIKSQKKQNRWLIIGVIALLSLISALYILYKQRIRTQKALLKNQEELATEKVNTLIESQKVKSMQSHLDGENKERERISKDLHDSISGNLAAIKMKLTNIKNSQSQEINAIISSIDTTYNEVRSISHNLSPKKIVEHNFTSSLSQLIELYRSEDLKLTLEVFPVKDLNQIHKHTQIEVYRILQELITNIIKHAQASKGLINLTLHNDYLNILIEDNGLGFDTTKKVRGIGMDNISSRIKYLNGNIDIDSERNKGTTININIPIKK